MKSFTKTIIIFLSLICSLSQASLYIEPIVGYHTGKTDYKYKDTINSGATDKGTLNGVGYGVGLGWIFGKNFSVGAEAQMFNLTSKFETETDKEKQTEIVSYVVVGYYVQPKARLYLGAGAFSSSDTETPKTTLTGSALKAGITYEFKNHISANIEYVLYGVNEAKTEGSPAIKLVDYYDHFNSTAAVWNFRFPFEF